YVHDRRRTARRHVAPGGTRILVLSINADNGRSYRIRFSEVRDTTPSRSGDFAAHDYGTRLGRARNWIRRFIFRCAGGRRLVHELGARAGICALRGLPDSSRSRVVDAVDPWNDVIS